MRRGVGRWPQRATPPTHTTAGLDIDPHHLTPGLPLYLLEAAGLADEETSPHQIPQLRPPAGSTWLGQALAAVFLLISVPLCVSLLFLLVFSALLYSLYYYYYHYY